MAKKNVTHLIDENIPADLRKIVETNKTFKDRSVNWLVNDILSKFIKKYKK